MTKWFGLKRIVVEGIFATALNLFIVAQLL